MNYIEQLYFIANDYIILTMVVGTLICFIESFIPVIPLIGIISANVLLLGLFEGLILSWIGSGIGTLVLFMLVSKFNDNKIINKFKNDKVEIAINWMNKQGFKLLFLGYSCPFIPSSLLTITAALCKQKISTFGPPMLAGKFVMFLAVSYPASDIKGFITNPFKVGVFLILVLLSWIIGNKVNNRLNESNSENKKSV